MNLRARSVEEVVELKYKCNNDTTDDKGETKKCSGSVDFKSESVGNRTNQT
jgi:hypothetical protein